MIMYLLLSSVHDIRYTHFPFEVWTGWYLFLNPLGEQYNTPAKHGGHSLAWVIGCELSLPMR